jgi:hypothetical protein
MKSFAIVLTLTLAACAGSDDSLATTSAALSSDAVQACPIPVLGDIAGHESVFYRCADLHAEHGQGCGADGYLLGYGTKYSERFYRNARPRMSTRGQRWIDDVLVCLQHDLREAIDESTSCEDIRTIAFDSHPACYQDAGFCTLSPFDIAQVVWTVDAQDWLSQDAARQIVVTALGCGKATSTWMHFFFWYLLD